MIEYRILNNRFQVCTACGAPHPANEPHYMWSPDWIEKLGLLGDLTFARIEPAIAHLDDEGKVRWRPLLEAEIKRERICRRLIKENPQMKWDDLQPLIHAEIKAGKEE